MMKRLSESLILLARQQAIKRKQFIIYALIGVCGVVIDYVAYALGVKVVGLGILIANFISISLGIINNFVLNTRYNFKVTDRLWVRFGLFYFVGFLGLIFSELLLLIFVDGFSLGALVAKLLTLPFVLVGQYLLNKYLSFGSVEESLNVLKKFGGHWPGYAVMVIFLVSSLVFVKYIPADFNNVPPARVAAEAPDEITHYTYNVQFILEHKRLPVSGKDDLSAYKNCRDNSTAMIPCLYSYTFYPGPSYLVNAASASIFSKAMHVIPQVASRFPSTLYGCVFILCCYFSSYLIARRRFIATLLTIGVGLIPQYIFVSSYTNLDAHSVAISGLLGLALVLFMQNPGHHLARAFLAITACGLLPLAKYNYFFLFIPVFVIVLWCYYRKLLNKRSLLVMAAWGLGSFLVLASFWYIRNLLLYHDPLGQSFALHEMSKYHSLGLSMPLRISSFVRLTDMNFFGILFNSFYLAYGGMIYYLDAYKYALPAILSIISAVFLVSHVAINKHLKPLVWAIIGYATVFMATLGQVIYNSMKYDFQPQGRYMFPILIPTALLLAYCYRLDKRLSILSVLLASSTTYIYLNGVELFVKVYMNVF